MDIEINKQNLAEITRLRDQAVQEQKESFSYKGKEMLVDYAKYVIEYLEGALK
jgi:hypothetical protein